MQKVVARWTRTARLSPVPNLSTSPDRPTARCRTDGECGVVQTGETPDIYMHCMLLVPCRFGFTSNSGQLANRREIERRKGGVHALYDCGCSCHIVAARARHFLHHGRSYPYSFGTRHHHDPSQSHQRATRVMTRCAIQGAGLRRHCALSSSAINCNGSFTGTGSSHYVPIAGGRWSISA